MDSKPGDPTKSEQASLMQSYPKGGIRDFSKKLYFEMWLEGTGTSGAGVDLWVTAGKLNEDSDVDKGADTEDLNNDGTLNAGEDVGYDYNFGTTTARIGGENGRVDAENLNGGEFRQSDGSFGKPLFRLSKLESDSIVTDRDGNAAPVSDLGFTGWRFIRVPLGDMSLYNAVEQVRISFVAGPSGTPVNTKVRIGKLAFVGNSWEKAVVSGDTSMSVAAVNNLDNPDYESLIGNPAYND
jgi:hypothetical protein